MNFRKFIVLSILTIALIFLLSSCKNQEIEQDNEKNKVRLLIKKQMLRKK